MVVRAYEPRDFEAAWRLDQTSYPPGVAYSRYALGEFLRLPGARAWVAEDKEQLVAFIIARHVSRRHGHIITLDVRADRRRQGIGSALLATAEEWLRTEGVTRMRLETAADDPVATAFWQQTGYVIVGRLPRYYLGRLDALRMEKDL